MHSLYKRSSIMMFALTLSGTVASTAFAAPHSDRFPISLADAQAKAEARFAEADVDGSGSIDLAEFENAKLPHPGKRLHGKRQHGKKGQRGEHRRGGKHSKIRTAAKEEIFAILDSNSDGSISKEEHSSADMRATRKLAMKRAMFKHLDKDKNQLLSVGEMPNPANFLSVADEDNDGYVSQEEMRANRRAIHRARRDN